MLIVPVAAVFTCCRGKTNFFEKRVTTYAKAAVGKDKAEMVFTTEATF